MKGYQAVVFRNGDAADIVRSVCMLALFAVVFTIVAVARLRVAEEKVSWM